MLAEGDNDGFLFDGKHRRVRLLGTSWQVGGRRPPLPFGDCLL